MPYMVRPCLKPLPRNKLWVMIALKNMSFQWHNCRSTIFAFKNNCFFKWFGSLGCWHIILHKLLEVLKVSFYGIEKTKQMSIWRTGTMSVLEIYWMEEYRTFVEKSVFLLQVKRREAWPFAQSLRVIGRGSMLSMLLEKMFLREKALRIHTQNFYGKNPQCKCIITTT